MQVNFNNINTKFGASFSREMESKLLACGKTLLRNGEADEYARLVENVRAIKGLIPSGIIELIPMSQRKIVYDKTGKVLCDIPVQEYGVYMTRHGENDVLLLDKAVSSPAFLLKPEMVQEMRFNLEQLAQSAAKSGRSSYDELCLSQKVKKDLL